ncbi:MAG: hypothetical protein EHM20_17515 [Alphaproteobacteria bacterium]|nr:MAG: hypothetical protein EHM20_17515 [Alphaproteobacteria bacterium]
MFKALTVFILLILIASNVYAQTVQCQLVGGVPSIFMVKKFSFTKINDGTKADFIFNTTKGVLNYPGTDCKEEHTPDSLYSCEHNAFVMILALDEKPLKAVINPIVSSGKEYGPFFYVCK